MSSPPVGYFVTGTDTGVGKTVVTLGLMRRLQDRGRQVVAMKPVASGCQHTAQGLRNADALQLQQQGSLPLEYSEVNPYAFEPAIAPHLAAAEAGCRIELATIGTAYRRLATQADQVCVEGIGGWLVPLNEAQTAADLASELVASGSAKTSTPSGRGSPRRCWVLSRFFRSVLLPVSPPVWIRKYGFPD
jgi:dethiobiotin synthetase